MNYPSKNPLSALLLLVVLAFTQVVNIAQAKGPAPRLASQTAQVFGDVGSQQNLVFSKSRKQVVSAVLHVTTTWQWDFVSLAGPTDVVTIGYQNSQSIAGNLNLSQYQAVVPFGYAPPSSYQFVVTYDVVINPASMTGNGSFVLPVMTTGSAVVEVGYTVVQVPRFITTAVLEYQTGR